jgi:hypothetical protein
MANTKGATKLTDKSIVKVVNNTIGSLSFRDADNRKHSFAKTGSSKEMDMKIVKGVYDDYETLITDGHIIFPDIRVYDFLGIPEEVYSKLITKEQIEVLLESEPETIKETLEDAPLNIKEKVAITAKQKGVDSRKVSKAIEEATGFKIEEQEI